jgi:hypothetical protein
MAAVLTRNGGNGTMAWTSTTGGIGTLQFPDMAGNSTWTFPIYTGTVMVAPTVPGATQVLYADANGNVTGSASCYFAAATNTLVIGTQSPLVAPGAVTRLLTVGGDGANNVVTLDCFGAVANIIVGRHTSGTKGTPLLTAIDQNLLILAVNGYTGAAYTSTVAQFAFTSLEAFSATNQGTYATLYLTPIGSTANACTFRQNGGGATFFPLLGTTASAANAYLNSGSTPVNQLLRSTSSLRYKEEVEDMFPALAEKVVAGARPIWFRSICEADQEAAPGTLGKRQSYYGLAAEEMAEIDPRFVFWAYPDECYEWEERLGEGGEVESRDRVLRKDATREQMIPDGVQYDRLVVPLLLVVQKLTKRIEELEARL